MIKTLVKKYFSDLLINLKINKFVGEPLIIKNINFDLNNINQKRVLISYVKSFLFQDLEQSKNHHTNIYESNQIIKTFINKGFCIDIIEPNANINLVKDAYDKYSIIFGFGKIFEYVSLNNKNAVKILYVTESSPEFSLVKEKERIDYFYLRHKKKVRIIRSGVFYNLNSFENATHLIVLSEIEQFEKINLPKFRIFPTGFYNSQYEFCDRNYNNSKKNFLWFGSNGAIHKGLDLLIDIFAKRNDINLHICGLYKEDRKILKIPIKKNIVDYGTINIQSEDFIKLVNRCSFVILPSCAEAAATSVLTCMNHSMIPIVSANTGFDLLKDLCVFLHDYHIDYIEKVINNIINMDNTEIKIMHEKVYNYSIKNFNLNRYTKEFSEIINNII